MEILSILIIGIGLSMDAFSLALGYGVLNIGESKRRMLAITVGLYHFFMPLLGMILGNVIEHYIIIDMRFVVFIIFMVIGLEMIFAVVKQEDKIILLNIIGMLLFGFTVSVDSFSAGIGIKLISNNYLLCCLIFSLTSLAFTYMGLSIGEIFSLKYKNKAKLLGGIIIIVFSLTYLFK